MLDFVLVCIALCPFEFYDHIDKEETVACCAFVVFWMSCYCKCPVALPHGAMCWSAVSNCGTCISDHTHLLFNKPRGV